MEKHSFGHHERHNKQLLHTIIEIGHDPTKLVELTGLLKRCVNTAINISSRKTASPSKTGNTETKEGHMTDASSGRLLTPFSANQSAQRTHSNSPHRFNQKQFHFRPDYPATSENHQARAPPIPYTLPLPDG